MIVTVCRGAADGPVWMMRLEAPIEVMVGTVSTLTEEQQEERVRPGVGKLLLQMGGGLTFDLSVFAVLLQLGLADDCRWLSDDSGGGDLLQHVDRLHGGLGGAGAHRRGHGVGHRLDGLR